MSGTVEEVRKHIGMYMKVGGALGVLTIVTVLASYMHELVPLAVSVVIALVIAATKGSLVASFFMHLVGERSRAIVWTLALTAVFWVVLMFLPLLGHVDQIGVPKTLSNANAPTLHAEEAAH